MANVIKVPAKVADRLIKQVPRYQKVLKEAQERVNGKGDNEANTGKIVVNMLSEVFGFDEFKELDKEYEIDGGDRCDVAVKIEGKVRYLVEIKAIRINLKDNHIKQVEAYGFRAGIRWVVLTNGVRWLVFRVLRKDKVTHEQVCDFDFLQVNPRTKKGQETLFLLCKRGVNKPKALIEKIYGRQQVVNKHTIAALIMSEGVQKIIIRELKKLGQNIKLDKHEIAKIITEQVIKRELIEGEEDKKIIKKVQKKLTRLKNQSARAANENKGPQEEESKALTDFA